MSKTLIKEKIRCPRGFLEEIKAIGVEKMHQIQSENEKNTKNQIFENFMQFLCTFRKTWWQRMLKTFSKEQIRCRGCFFEEIKALVLKKCTKYCPKMTKTQKIQVFKTLCSFCVILERLGGFELQRRSARSKLVVRKTFLRKSTKFFNETNAQFATKNDNNFNMYRFFTFPRNFCQVSKDFMDRIVKYVQPRMISLSNSVVCGEKCSFVRIPK